MKKAILFPVIIGSIVFVIAALSGPTKKDPGSVVKPFESATPAPALDHKNIAYTVGSETITLKDGVSEAPAAPGSAEKIITRYFGNEAKGDLNGDGTEDVAFILTQEPGGSGTFYYVAAALKFPEGYKGTNAVELGDRIAPQTTEVRDGVLIANYADRRSDEPLTAAPTQGRSMYLAVLNGVLKEEPVVVFSPKRGQSIALPLTVSGVARGNWYFEASFPLELKDAAGNTIGQSHVMAQGDWMTTDYVPFSGEIDAKIKPPSGGRGTLIVHKDNPSGLPQFEDSREVPIIFP